GPSRRPRPVKARGPPCPVPRRETVACALRIGTGRQSRYLSCGERQEQNENLNRLLFLIIRNMMDAAADALSRSPHCLLGPAELLEFGGPERRLRDRKELVELRRRDGGCRQHRVRLATMMDLMLEEMHQQTVASLGLH